MKAACPLCAGGEASPLFEDRARRYHHCPACDVRFLERACWMTPEQEKARYLTHNNDVLDPRYQDFVRGLYDELRSKAAPGARGLDFGAGTGPVLAHMLGQAGFDMKLYDTYFHPERDVLELKYDFIAASEVVEHMREHKVEFERLKRLLKPGGWLGIMTWLWDDAIDFAGWSYRKDPTHLVFYSQASLRWIARRHGFTEVSFPARRLILLRA